MRGTHRVLENADTAAQGLIELAGGVRQVDGQAVRDGTRYRAIMALLEIAGIAPSGQRGGDQQRAPEGMSFIRSAQNVLVQQGGGE